MTYDEEPDDLFSDGPSKAQVDATVRAETTRQQRQRNDVLIARWRQQHKDATCSDAVALELARWQFCWFKDRETP